MWVSATVIGDQAAQRPAKLGVDEHSKRQGEKALSDALQETTERLGQMLFEAHLALQVGEHRLDHQSNRGLCNLSGWTFAEAVALRRDQLHRDELHRALILRAPEPLVGEEHGAWMGLGEPKERLALTFCRRQKVIAQWDPHLIGNQDQAHPPVEATLGGTKP